MAVMLVYLVVLLDGEKSAVVATVDGQSIHTAEVEAELRQAYGERELAAAERPRLFQAALEQTIDRCLVLNHLAKTGQSASQNDIAIALAQFEKELASQSLTLAQHCEKVGITKEDVRRALAWKVAWRRYCEKHLTAQNLERYFERQRRDFDGTQLRIGQILFKSSGDTEAAAAKKRAAGIRQEIVAGKISFADAARQHSEAPSREANGDIGWIERHKPMPEEFSRLAFSLKKGEVSEPFVSPFGVHLITVLDEKPGTKTWQEVNDELQPAVVLYLFRWLADKERASANIEYSAAK